MVFRATRFGRWRRPAGVLGLSGAALLVSACTTAWARGIVRDQAGQPVAGATVTIAAAGSKAPAGKKEKTLSEANGCFNLVVPAKKEQASFVVTIRAAGYQDVRATFSRQERLTAKVTLLAEGQPGGSSLTPLSGDDVRQTYEEPCLPKAVPGATSLGLR